MPKALANGIRIYYEVYGQGEPILLIMGLGGSALGWQSQIPTLSQHLRAIVYDNRDAGRSDKIAIEYAMADMADDAAGLLDHRPRLWRLDGRHDLARGGTAPPGAHS
jgi:3-oxoadipate enol-lactonase